MSVSQPSRSRIGRHLSYPLKFTEITLALGPVYEQLAVGVSFWGYRAPRLNEVRDCYPVLEIAHNVWAGEVHYRLAVSAVPRLLRATIHALLIPAELARVREWLLAPRTPHWHATYHALRVNFSPPDQCLLRYEHNAP